MNFQRSFTGLEKELLPAFRIQMGSAESTEDVKKFFARTAQELLQRVFAEEELEFEYREIKLNPMQEPYFTISTSAATTSRFQELCMHSDLNDILERFARTAANHYKRVEGNSDKTELKMYHGTEAPADSR